MKAAACLLSSTYRTTFNVYAKWELLLQLVGSLKSCGEMSTWFHHLLETYHSSPLASNLIDLESWMIPEVYLIIFERWYRRITQWLGVEETLKII